MTERSKPGESAPSKGDYQEVGPRGGQVRDGNTVAIPEKGTTLPPTREPNRRWEKR